MKKRRPLYTMLFAALALLGLFGTDRAAHADFIAYEVTVDTSSISGQYGYLDFQFNPGSSTAAAATATITNFSTNGILNPNDPANNDPNNTFGHWSGSLTSNSNPLTLYNDADTEFFEGFSYGSRISFEVTLSGNAIGSQANGTGTAFAFSLYDNTTYNPLLTTDPNGSVITLSVNGNGSTSVETFGQSPTDNTPAASASVVPAPPSIVLLLTAVPVGLFFWRRSRQSDVEIPAVGKPLTGTD
jgi:hypothetical protein